MTIPRQRGEPLRQYLLLAQALPLFGIEAKTWSDDDDLELLKDFVNRYMGERECIILDIQANEIVWSSGHETVSLCTGMGSPPLHEFEPGIDIDQPNHPDDSWCNTCGERQGDTT